MGQSLVLSRWDRRFRAGQMGRLGQMGHLGRSGLFRTLLSTAIPWTPPQSKSEPRWRPLACNPAIWRDGRAFNASGLPTRLKRHGGKQSKMRAASSTLGARTRRRCNGRRANCSTCRTKGDRAGSYGRLRASALTRSASIARASPTGAQFCDRKSEGGSDGKVASARSIRERLETRYQRIVPARQRSTGIQSGLILSRLDACEV
jgi:hypothetical protein